MESDTFEVGSQNKPKICLIIVLICVIVMIILGILFICGLSYHIINPKKN